MCAPQGPWLMQNSRKCMHSTFLGKRDDQRHNLGEPTSGHRWDICCLIFEIIHFEDIMGAWWLLSFHAIAWTNMTVIAHFGYFVSDITIVEANRKQHDLCDRFRHLRTRGYGRLLWVLQNIRLAVAWLEWGFIYDTSLSRPEWGLIKDNSFWRPEWGLIKDDSLWGLERG